MNREDGFSLSRAWKPLICDLKEWRQSLTKESPSPMGPEKGWLRLSCPPPHWCLLGVSPLAQLSLYLTLSWLSLSFRLSFLPLCIICLIPSIVTSALKMETVRFSETLASTSCHTAPKPRRTSLSSLLWKPQISYPFSWSWRKYNYN
jgi:hypothetical protein